MASAVLGLIMLAVATAIGAAQKMAFESQKRLLASIAADDLMSEISTLAYDDLGALNGTTNEIGGMKTLDLEAYPETFWALGRRIDVLPETLMDEASGVSVEGSMITVSCFDEFTDLAIFALFVPDPDTDAPAEPLVAGGGR